MLGMIQQCEEECDTWRDFFRKLTHRTSATQTQMPPHRVSITVDRDNNTHRVTIEGSIYKLDYTGNKHWKWDVQS